MRSGTSLPAFWRLIALALALAVALTATAQDEAETADTPTDPLTQALMQARELIEEEHGGALKVMRWRFYEDDWASEASLQVYGSFGIDNCVAEVPMLLKRADELFGWTFSILDASGKEYQARVSYDLEETALCDEVRVPPRYGGTAAAAAADPAAGDPAGDPGQTAPPPSTANTGGFELGGQALSFAHPNHMKNARMTWVKRQVKWHGESAGTFQSWIDHAHGLGFRILLSVIGDKNQIAGNPGGYYQNFANFLAGLARGGADAIEVWNEMNIDREWPSGQISGGNYTQMLSAAYHAIKSANSGTLVVSGAPAPTGFFQGCGPGGGDDDCYLREMAAAGAANVMDCVGVHYNAGIVPPDATSGAPVGSSGHYSWYLPRMMQLYRSFFPSKPLCITELGYLTGEGIGALPGGFAWASGNTLAEQAAWLAGAIHRTRGSGYVRMMIVWNVDSTHWGADPQSGYAIVRPGGGCPACDTMRVAMGG